MVHDTTPTLPTFSPSTARAILRTLEELKEYVGLSQEQIDLKKTAKQALAYWASQEGRAE